MLIGLGVASTNRTDKFWHTGSAEEYSSEEFDGWGVRAYARVWRSYLQAVLNECYFWFRQYGDVISYVILHYLYSDVIVVWMWYSTGIWVIRSTTVLLHFDSVDFPSWKSGLFHKQIIGQNQLYSLITHITRTPESKVFTTNSFLLMSFLIYLIN